MPLPLVFAEITGVKGEILPDRSGKRLPPEILSLSEKIMIYIF